MAPQVIDDLVEAVIQEIPPRRVEQADHAKPSLDGLRFHDQSKSRSSQVTRAFASVIRAASQGQQSEMSVPHEVLLAPDVAISDAEIATSGASRTSCGTDISDCWPCDAARMTEAKARVTCEDRDLLWS